MDIAYLTLGHDDDADDIVKKAEERDSPVTVDPSSGVYTGLGVDDQEEGEKGSDDIRNDTDRENFWKLIKQKRGKAEWF